MVRAPALKAASLSAAYRLETPFDPLSPSGNHFFFTCTQAAFCLRSRFFFAGLFVVCSLAGCDLYGTLYSKTLARVNYRVCYGRVLVPRWLACGLPALGKRTGYRRNLTAWSLSFVNCRIIGTIYVTDNSTSESTISCTVTPSQTPEHIN